MPYAMNRLEIIEHVLNDLRELKSTGSFPNHYAIRENIRFFEACKSIFAYIKWLIVYAPKIERERILELTDFPFPKWDQEMHRKLIELEKRDFPGLVKPLVKRILFFLEQENKLLIIVNFGCGGMEVERQVIKNILKKNNGKRIIFIGVDKSQIVHEIAKKNLIDVESHIDLHEVENLDEGYLKRVVNSDCGKHSVILCKNNIFEFTKFFPKKSFDLIFHTLFRHHLTPKEKEEVDRVSIHIANRIFEYDGYKSWPHIIIPHTFTAWNFPVFLNASIFSDLRYSNKRELLHSREENWHLSFFKIGTYLREYYPTG